MSSKQPSQQSPLKKMQKRVNQLDQQQMYSQPKKSGYSSMQKSPFLSEGQKINFQSQDSEGSDISYQSSIESQEDINIGQIDYFKQEMGRFFINYPELINDGILYDQEDDQIDFNRNGQVKRDKFKFTDQKPQNLNKNWTLIADQILNQAKQSSSFLQSLSRRIALYRSKIYQQDLIDILLKQQKNIMKEIQLQINLKKKQNKGTKNVMIQHAQGCQNVYFSWRKKKQIQNKLNLHKEDDQKQKNFDNNDPNKSNKSPNKRNINNNTFRNRANTLSNKKLSQQSSTIYNKKISQAQSTKVTNFFLTTNDNQINLSKQNSKNFYRKNQDRNDSKILSFQSPNSNIKRPYSLGKNNKQSFVNQKKSLIQESEKQNKNGTIPTGPTQTFWKHLVNFQPRTQAGRQLCELIRRTNNPNDQLGIKKTIMQFLIRNKETVQNEVILKSTISQKIQKLYNDDSKQLLMFYPTKMTHGQNGFGQNKQDNTSNENNRQSALISNALSSNLQGFMNQNQIKGGGQTNLFKGLINENGPDLSNKLFDEGQKFIHLLQDIVDGPLMKYWMMIQENKL